MAGKGFEAHLVLGGAAVDLGGDKPDGCGVIFEFADLAVDGAHLLDAEEAEFFGLGWDEDVVGGVECVDGEDVGVGGAVDDDDVPVAASGGDGVGKGFDAVEHALGKADGGVGEIEGGGDDGEIVVADLAGGAEGGAGLDCSA